MLTIIGLFLGMVTAVGIHWLTGWLRLLVPIPLAVLGSIVAARLSLLAFQLILAFLRREDPYGIALIFALIILLFLSVPAAVAIVPWKRDGTPYWQAFGHLTAQFFATCWLLLFLAGAVPELSSQLPWFFTTVLVGLPALEIARPFRGHPLYFY